MPKEPDNDTTPADTQPAESRRNPLPPLTPSGVEHVTLSGGLFGGLDVMRNEYIDKSKPRRNWLQRLLHGS
jgi:hypothetical protein